MDEKNHQLLMFMELEPFFYYFEITKTLNISNVKYILAYLNQYSPIKTAKALWDNYINNILDGRK